MAALITDLGHKIAGHFPNLTIADDLYSRRTYSKDLWPRNLILAREDQNHELGEPSIDLVVWPQSPQELSEIVLFCNENNVEMYPYGAGSGVCGGATPNSEKSRARVVVDLKKMDRIETIDEQSLVAKIQAGILGQVLEDQLNAKGFTLGHFPSSIMCSSFGGYLATRAAGQLSTYYGKIEDMVLATEGVLPSGEIFSTPLAPRLSVGPDWNQLMLGSEGTLAFLTSAWVQIHRLSQERKFLSFDVKSTVLALDGVRKWLQAGLKPAVVRIYDEDESRLLHNAKSGVKCICVVEGEASLTDFTASQMAKLAAKFDGWSDTGEEPAQHWWSHRYDVSFYQQMIMSHRRMILDTFEVSTSWSKLFELHQRVKSVANSFDDGMLILLAHFSHFYRSGGNIYFTLCGRSPKELPTVNFYDQVWDKLLKTCEEQGAAISHHHGIGRLKAKAFERQRGVFFEIFKKLKHELDPKNLLNPSNLGI